MHSPDRFYYYNPKTGEEIKTSISNIFEGGGKFIGTVKGLKVRDEIYVYVSKAEPCRTITIADFPGFESIKVKFWSQDKSQIEYFYLSSKEVLAKYNLVEQPAQQQAATTTSADLCAMFFETARKSHKLSFIGGMKKDGQRIKFEGKKLAYFVLTDKQKAWVTAVLKTEGVTLEDNNYSTATSQDIAEYTIGDFTLRVQAGARNCGTYLALDKWVTDEFFNQNYKGY
jgi:hypothetical protein